VNAWLIAACVLLAAGMGPCLWRVCTGDPAQRLIGMTLGGTIAIGVSLLIARGVQRTSYIDVALVLAVLSPAGTLVFCRCLAGGTHTVPHEGRATERS
jgi:multisubunit Na+/H+ antiporter MnhF subunit